MQWEVPWCFGRDFNVVRFPHEERGGRIITRGMERFSEFINENELMDLPLGGRRYTWYNNQVRVAMSRLDRFLFRRLGGTVCRRSCGGRSLELCG